MYTRFNTLSCVYSPINFSSSQQTGDFFFFFHSPTDCFSLVCPDSWFPTIKAKWILFALLKIHQMQPTLLKYKIPALKGWTNKGGKIRRIVKRWSEDVLLQRSRTDQLRDKAPASQSTLGPRSSAASGRRSRRAAYWSGPETEGEAHTHRAIQFSSSNLHIRLAWKLLFPRLAVTVSIF